METLETQYDLTAVAAAVMQRRICRKMLGFTKRLWDLEMVRSQSENYDGKNLKTFFEVEKIRQEMERKAWGFADADEQDDTATVVKWES